MNEPTESDRPQSPHESPEFVVVGKIRGAWGLRGDIRVEILTDFPQRFEVGEVLYLEGQPAKIVRARPSNKGLIIGLDIVPNRTKAESTLGKELSIPSEQVGALPEGSYYHFQLLDMDVWSEENEYLGKVHEIISTEGNDVYVLALEGQRKDLLIPALKDVILYVNVQENKMIVRLPEVL